MTRIPYETMKAEIKRILIKRGMTEARAEESATLFTQASLDGVYSHGLNRVPRFADYIEKGWVNIDAEPTVVDKVGIIERYDGNLGPGDLNAKYCMDRAIKIAKENGIGLVTIKNTSHWMRGGNYGWQAAEVGCIGICWTNTESCMPPWGAKNSKMGNNPMIFAVPYKNGHVVLDMAMSQFSYGKLEVTRLKGEELPIDGGFDEQGNLTRNPAEIEKSMRILPTGYWKGSGLSFLLDIIAGILSGGLSTAKIDEIKPGPTSSGYGISQVFIAVDPNKLSGAEFAEQIVNDAITHLHGAEAAEGNSGVYYPGERTAKTREDNLKNGIPVDDRVWNTVLEL
ncbi:3-dehydro-L-gulonate 2-dehydrogenase [Alkalihalobacillus deserti]|uniref:3-dehydro-L-gulonate 2-dehydrogenase n=1 Tax=Alkalihalobacillus deserti TaxID=2879466 RepID=UPI001D154BF0|nr:3-dehydro-L-gulonate 2-dehydrogenase [Alkalihalobacillus deserti]